MVGSCQGGDAQHRDDGLCSEWGWGDQTVSLHHTHNPAQRGVKEHARCETIEAGASPGKGNKKTKQPEPHGTTKLPHSKPWEGKAPLPGRARSPVMQLVS